MKLDGELVRKKIYETNRNLKQFCDDTGIKDYNLSKYLAGANVPRRVMRIISDDLGVDMLEIMRLTGFDY